MGIKDFLTQKLVEKQLKHLPKEQQEIILAAVKDNPKFFTKINDEIKVKKKAGMDEQLAGMQVMRAHQGEMQKMLLKYSQKK